MILLEAQVDGFGCLVGQHFSFGEGLTVIAGPNESGKTTLADCIVRLLFGYPEHQYSAALEFRRPWKGQAFAATIVYRLDDGRVLETHRDFSRSNVPTQTVERDLRRPVPELSGTRGTSPGMELLHISKEAYEAAAVMGAGALSDEVDKRAYEMLAERIAALVGSAGDAGAQAALDRLDAFAKELGSERAPARPVRQAQDKTASARKALDEYRSDAARMRDNFSRRADLMATLAASSKRARDVESQVQRARLAHVRARIGAAEAAEAALAAASVSRSHTGASPEVLERSAGIEAAIDAWKTARGAEQDAALTSQSKEDQRNDVLQHIAACDAKLKEADAAIKRNTDAIARLAPESSGTVISADALDHLEQLSDLADTQDAAARTKETQAAINRQRPRTGALPALFVFAIALVTLAAGAIAHVSALVVGAVLGVIAAVGLGGYFVFTQRRRSAADKALEEHARQSRGVADAAAAGLAKEYAALGVADIRAARRARAAQSEVARYKDALAAAQQLAVQTREQVTTLEARFNDFNRSDRQLVDARARATDCAAALGRLFDDAGVAGGDVEARIAAFRDARHEIEGAVLAEKAVGEARAARASALGGETLDALRGQMRALAAGIDDTADQGGSSGDAATLQRQLDELLRTKHVAEKDIERIEGDLATYNRTYPGGGARLEEQLSACEADEARLTRARDAAVLARAAIEKSKDEVHRNFAPHLNALAGPALAEITAGRYREVFVDPRDFALRVLSPENGATVDIDTLSSGTQEQLYVSLRAAIAQALGKEDERVPLLLDDALAFSDEDRLVGAVRHLAHISRRQQVLLFTQRDAVLAAARATGATVVRLSGPGGVPA
jgi:DNA polymerase III delta prime subunit